MHYLDEQILSTLCKCLDATCIMLLYFHVVLRCPQCLGRLSCLLTEKYITASTSTLLSSDDVIKVFFVTQNDMQHSTAYVSLFVFYKFYTLDYLIV